MNHSHRPDEKIHEARSLIDDAELSHPYGPLLTSFIENALNPRSAASYLLANCDPAADAQSELMSLVSDWRNIVESVTQHGATPPAPDAPTKAEIVRRDGHRCCITGKAGSLGDPLIVAPILPMPIHWNKAEPRAQKMLDAFLGPGYKDWWLDYVENPQYMNTRHNHWLVLKSAAAAFSKSAISLNRLQPSMVEYEVKTAEVGLPQKFSIDGSFPLLGDHSRTRIDKLDPRFIGTHARLSDSIRWLEIQKQMAIEKLPAGSANHEMLYHSNRSYSSIFGDVLLKLWLIVPSSLRIATYLKLKSFGLRWYGNTDMDAPVQRLPFGLYLKHVTEADSLQNEFCALQAVRQHTSVPVPRPLDFVTGPKQECDGFITQDAYLLTSRISGLPLTQCFDVISDANGLLIVEQMQNYLRQLRKIPKKVNPDFAICSILGKEIRDPRIRYGDAVGPFKDEAAFSRLLRNPDEPSRRGHKIVFTHADLNYRNILVDQKRFSNGSVAWQITGIVDWETCGFYPEYWDYTKALYEGFRWPRRWQNYTHAIFGALGDYSKEREVEHRSWSEGD